MEGIVMQKWVTKELVDYTISTAYENYPKDVIDKTTIDYALQKIDPTGKQAQVILSQGNHGLSEVQIAVQYIKYRIFKRDKLKDFLSGITKLEFIPLKEKTEPIKNPEYYNQQAITYFHAGNHEMAENLFRQTLILAPNNLLPLLILKVKKDPGERIS